MIEAFRPVLYLKSTCPHCLKLRIFLLEAGLLERFDQRIFTQGDDAEAAIRADLAAHFDKVTFPAVQYEPGRFMKDSDAIIAHYAAVAGVDVEGLPIFAAYAQGVLPKYMETRRELTALKQDA
ncbi:glutathione S-transferase-like protein [Novosphingobium sp. PhB57]|jgi:glutaredoxin 2|uniref:glutathione S-transferase N-terminal domain-containing protein n=1 Tax=Novosphingobium sp. PhB57 TaxID=2485107 RepID=UPI0010433008|nr:glutathione S-transferase N-terminal domain-containing protein [Novosphingobium sp. PhB57]TCU53606.1 glutathione S-transferase-like protein [Novosphingobium sp. PhB57]